MKNLIKIKIVALTALTALSANADVDATLYKRVESDGNTSVVRLYRDGSMSIAQTLQVGGSGGLTQEGIVPYPTVCRLKQWAHYTKRFGGSIDYTVKYAYLEEDRGRDNSPACDRYINELNGRAQVQTLVYSLDLTKFDKVDPRLR